MGGNSDAYYERYWLARKAPELNDFRFKWPVLKSYMPSGATGTILDYGCGKGKVLLEIRKMNPKAHLYGLDVSKEGLHSAKKIVSSATIRQIMADKPLPLASDSVDFVISLDVIEHVYDVELLLTEFSRILKSEGTLIVSTPYHGLIKNLIISLVGFETVFDPIGSHIRFFTKKSLMRCLESSGFSIEHFGLYGRFYPVNNGMFVVATKH